MKKRRIIRNAAQCSVCKDIVESKHRHDFVMCSCGSVFVDGGTDYIRAGGSSEHFIEMYEFEDVP